MTKISIFGAGGRAGRAITAEARRRGHQVTAVVRDPIKHSRVAGEGVRLAAGDVTDRRAVAALAAGHDAVVHAVSPASSPETVDAADPWFFADAADALVGGMSDAGVDRMIAVGHFATLQGREGGFLFDDPATFPVALRPFARSHLAGLDRLRAGGAEIDWVMLTPPAQLDPDGTRSGSYRVGGDRVADAGGDRLSYADLAVAIVDQIDAPTQHRTRVSVRGADARPPE